MSKPKLTGKRAAFVAEYLLDYNATQAAIRAGYSVKTAQEQGSRLSCNVMVAEAIAAAQADRSERLGLTVDDVVARLTAIINGEASGVRTSDRLRAIELLGRHLGMFGRTAIAAEPEPVTRAPRLDLSHLSDEELQTVIGITAKIKTVAAANSH
jgi:hypothetical protein